YPQSDKIDDAAFQLGEIYESKAYKQYRRAAMYYERTFQWNQNTQFEARLRAARLYDKQLNERARAIELYKEVTTHETDTKGREESRQAICRYRRRATYLSPKRFPAVLPTRVSTDRGAFTSVSGPGRY